MVRIACCHRAIMYSVLTGTLIACGLIQGGCSDTAQRSVTSTPSEIERSANEIGSESFQNIHDLLSAWEQLDREHLISAALEMTSQQSDGSHLRIFTLSESEFVSLGEEEMYAAQQAHIRIGQSLLEMSRHLIEIADSLAANGQPDDAAALCEAVAAFGSANNDPSLSRLARSYGRTILTLAESRCPVDWGDK